MPARYDIDIIDQFIADAQSQSAQPHEDRVHDSRGRDIVRARRIQKAAEALTQCEEFLGYLRCNIRKSGNFFMSRELALHTTRYRSALETIRVLVKDEDAVLTRRVYNTVENLESLIPKIQLLDYDAMEGYFDGVNTLPTGENALRMMEELRQYALYMQDKILNAEECVWMRQCLQHVVGAIEVALKHDAVTGGKIAAMKQSLETLVKKSEKPQQ